MCVWGAGVAVRDVVSSLVLRPSRLRDLRAFRVPFDPLNGACA